MPVGTYSGPQTSTGNGVTTVFPYNFRILQSADLRVALDGVTQSSGYTVSGVGDTSGGNVTFTSAPANGVIVLRERLATYDRSDDYQRSGAFTEEAVDKDFDRAVMLIQQLKALSDRVPKISAGHAVAGDSFVLPAPGAGYYIRWNAGGTALEAVAAVNDPGNVTLGTQTRSVSAMFEDRVSVLNYIPVALHAAIRNGTSTTPVDTYIRAAMVANRGRTVCCPAGYYYCTAPIQVGGPTATDYHSLEGEGPAIYSDNSDYPRTIFYFNNSQGVQIYNAYQGFRNITIIGTQQGGSDPTTGVLADLKRIGLSLSTAGGTSHGGYSRVRDVSVSGFDTGVAVQPGAFLAYSDLENMSSFGNVTGWAFAGSITDLHLRGGVTVDNSGRGVIALGAARVSFSNHLFETSGATSVNKSSAAICAHDESQIVLTNCGLQDDTNYFCDYDARIECIGCNPVSANKFFGSGEFIFHNSLGRALDVPVPKPDAWTLSNVTVAAVSDATNPASYRIQSSSAPASIQMHVDIPVADIVSGLDRKGLKKTIDDVRDYAALEYEIVFNQTDIPAAWTAAAGFSPVLSVFCFGAGGQDNWEAVDGDTSASVFANNKVVRINQIVPLTWGAAALNGTIEKFRILISFSDGATRGYNVNALNAYMTRPKLTYFQRNRET